MKYTVRESVVRVIGSLWMPGTTAAQDITMTDDDVSNAMDAGGNVTRESLALWLGAHTGDFSGIDDFWASIEVGEDTVDIPWASEESEFEYHCMSSHEDCENDEDDEAGEDGPRRLAIRISNDLDAPNPVEDAGWKLYSFSRKHVNYRHRDDVLALTEELADGRAFQLSWFGHGSEFWMLRGTPKGSMAGDWRHDGVDYAGVLVWEGNDADLPESLEDRKAWATSLVEAYTYWCNGEGYAYDISDAADGYPIDSGSGYLGTDAVLAAAVFGSGLVQDDDVIAEATGPDGRDILGEVLRMRPRTGAELDEAYMRKHSPSQGKEAQ